MKQVTNLSQADIAVDVGFYDNVEEQKLLQYPTANEIAAVVSTPIRIPVAEFLAYYLRTMGT